jgi:hypothetical protein
LRKWEIQIIRGDGIVDIRKALLAADYAATHLFQHPNYCLSSGDTTLHHVPCLDANGPHNWGITNY